MATVAAINALCSGLAQMLSRARQMSPLVQAEGCNFVLAGSADLRRLDGQTTTCSIFVYRVTHNEHQRNLRPPTNLNTALTLDVHLMFTIWADTPVKEQLLHAWLLRELHAHSVLDRAVLGTGFGEDEVVQLIPAELPLDDLTKIWQALTLPYRLSATCIARNLRIDRDAPLPDAAPVIARRFRIGDPPAGGAP